MTRNPSWPRFLSSPDPNLDPDYVRRAAYAYPAIVQERMDRRLLLDSGYGPAPLDVDTALQMFERLAAETLP